MLKYSKITVWHFDTIFPQKARKVSKVSKSNISKKYSEKSPKKYFKNCPKKCSKTLASSQSFQIKLKSIA